ncbi:phage tail protein [Pseudomonas atacamensis]|uniref:phage tail protein n=1 Tax=Pseudomonas atacamensis TaxID=2565368 RepID=UPI0021D96007|nr:phage tail protein [Pseudomonas atacamensis]
MFAILGDIEFTVAGGVSAIEHSGAADWAEHLRMQGKPLLEWVGEGLDECQLTLELHPVLGDPEQRLRALRLAKTQHQPLAWVMGSGEYLGPYVITHLSNVIRRTSATGQLLAATLQISLREYTGAFIRKAHTPGLLDPTARDTAPAMDSPGVISRQAAAPSTAQNVIRHAKTAGNVLHQAQIFYQWAEDGDPVDILAQVPQLLGVTAQAIEPLQGLASAAGLLHDGADLSRLGEDVLGSVMGARDCLNPVDLASIVNRFGASHEALDQAVTVLDGASDRLAGLAADILTRRR